MVLSGLDNADLKLILFGGERGRRQNQLCDSNCHRVIQILQNTFNIYRSSSFRFRLSWTTDRKRSSFCQGYERPFCD